MVKQSTALNIANEYLQAVVSSGVKIRKAYLFGSHASGRQHKWSDIDIALIADDFTGVAALDKDRFRHLHLLPQFMALETHTFTTKHWLAGDPFVKEILKTGIELKLARISASV